MILNTEPMGHPHKQPNNTDPMPAKTRATERSQTIQRVNQKYPIAAKLLLQQRNNKQIDRTEYDRQIDLLDQGTTSAEVGPVIDKIYNRPYVGFEHTTNKPQLTPEQATNFAHMLMSAHTAKSTKPETNIFTPLIEASNKLDTAKTLFPERTNMLTQQLHNKQIDSTEFNIQIDSLVKSALDIQHDTPEPTSKDKLNALTQLALNLTHSDDATQYTQILMQLHDKQLINTTEFFQAIQLIEHCKPF